MPQSTGQKKEEELKKQPPQKIYTEAEMKAYGFYIDRIRKARDQRETANEFFDGLTYSFDYKKNRQAANTYLRPKKNDDEVRIASGTTEKKIEVIHNELMNLNFQHEVEAFTKDDLEMSELGKDMEGIVTRTNQIERESDVISHALWEMITQRACFLQEDFITKKYQGTTLQMFQKNLLSGLKVFLGDISLPLYKINDQPYICIYDRIHFKEFQSLFPKNEYKNAKFVRPGMTSNEEFNTAFSFRFGELEKEEVELIWYYSFPDDECQCIANGHMMYEIGKQLPWRYNGYNLRGFGLKPMSTDFAYCKPLTASSKVLEGLNTEMLRNMVRKWRQAIEPPMALKGKRIYSRDIFQASAMTPGLKKDDFEKLIDLQGVTSSEIAMYDLIQKKTEEFIGAGSLQQGLEGDKKTATETLELQKNFLKSLGFAVFGALRMREEMTYLRIYNLIENGLNPIDKRLNPISRQVENVYQKYTLKDTEIDDGLNGKKIFMMNDRSLSMPEKQDIYNYEKEQERIGKNIRIKSINMKMLQEIPIIWFVRAVAKQRDSSALERAMSREKLAEGVEISKITGRPINGNQIINDFERTWNSKGFFQDENQAQAMPMINPQTGQNADQLGSQISQTANKTVTPSLNTLVGQSV
jgi:hypothetical protein